MIPLFDDNELALLSYEGTLVQCTILSAKVTREGIEYLVKLVSLGKEIYCSEKQLSKFELTEEFKSQLLKSGVISDEIPIHSSKTKPSHYPDAGGDDWIGFAMRHKVGAIEFNIGKYVLRHDKKDGKQDLLKAQEYLKRLIDSYE